MLIIENNGKGLVRAPACRLGCALLGIVLFAGSAAAGIAPVEYSLIDLGTLPGDSGSSASALNDGGQVVGGSGSPGRGSRAFLYSAGKMIDLGAPGNSAAPIGSGAAGINNSGQIVGSFGGLSSTTGFLYSGGTLQYLSTAAVRTSASGINASGPIVGSSDFGALSGNFHAVLFSGGSMHDLGTLGGMDSGASAINDAGQITGQSQIASDPNISHPFLYSNGTMHDIGTLGGADGQGYAINNRGQIVGQSNPDPGDHTIAHAFVYTNGSMHDLGTLGGKSSTARAINDSGIVVGDSYLNSSGASDHGFVYLDGTMYDLNGLITNGSGYVVEDASGINSSGQIAATATTPSGGTDAVLLTPTTASAPLPPAPWAALTALPLLVLGRRMSPVRR